MKLMTKAPIIVTVYDRLKHFQQCIGALQRNVPANGSELYVVSDAASKPEHAARIDLVRAYARSITGFKKVHLVFREKNYGANRSFIDITSQVVNEHGSFIFLEDDVIVAPDFLDYMNGGLNYYEANTRIFSIAAYTLPLQFPKDFKADVFFVPSNCPWGFATWKDRWERVDLTAKDRYAIAVKDSQLYKRIVSTGLYMMHILQADSQGRLQAPDVRVAFHQFVHEEYTVYPRISRTKNIGLDGSGLHSGTDKNDKYLIQFGTSIGKIVFDADVHLNQSIITRIRNYQDGNLLARLVTSLSLVKRRWMSKIAANSVK